MEKYLVSLVVYNSENGKIFKEELENEYSSGNLLKDRKKAIKKGKKWLKKAGVIRKEGEVLSSYDEAKIKSLHFYALYIFLVSEDGEFYPIYGDKPYQRCELLEYEAKVFRKHSLNVKYTQIVNADNEFIEVVNYDLNFLLNDSFEDSNIYFPVKLPVTN